MLGDFITRLLILVLGYAYPAFECYKIIEKNRVEIEELRFWCQYWILVAMLTVCERIADVFVSWLPMYGELKLAFFIYLWYPKTKGSGYVYDTLLKPVVSKHETDIDRKILEMRARAWDLALYYWHNCTELGSAKFFEMLQFLAGQSARFSSNINQKSNQQAPSAPPLPEMQNSGKPHKWSSSSSGGQPSSPTVNRAVSEPMKPNMVQVHTRSPSEPVNLEDHPYPDSPSAPASPNDSLLLARLRLRRQTPHH
ncbi:putative HVA22-like protein g [Pistacia vera]|uniref:putative HVA22-like protein g n=1 Tax=Pistacia vera TaxID=55513 RepID=UPI0012630340|nr:putative HVA22-like protein g [Pistacia vera]XP_031285141.1 putative HVA22-like protein g [Pistacia vera]